MYLLFYRGKFIEKIEMNIITDVQLQQYQHGTYINSDKKWYRVLSRKTEMIAKGIHHSHVPKNLKMMVLLLK